MKKILVLVLAGLLTCSMFGCGSEQEEPQTTENVSEEETEEPEEPEEEAQEQEPEVEEEVEAEVEEPEAETQQVQEDTSTGLRPEFKQAMDSYEKFMNEYCEFMKKYEASGGTDPTLLVDYTKYMSDYAKVVADFEAWDNGEMNNEEMAYYLDVQNRVTKKLLEVSQ